MLGTNTQPARRLEVPSQNEVTGSGVTARIVNLSVTGAQVTSSSVLRPNQDLKLVLSDYGKTFKLAGVVVWSEFELGHGQPRYRAGITFTVPMPQEVWDHIVRAEPADEPALALFDDDKQLPQTELVPRSKRIM